MNRLSIYTGISYDFRSYNCWHHVIKVRSDNGLSTPEFDCVSPEFINDSFEFGHSDNKGMTQVSEPDNFCAVLIKSKGNWHSGVYFNGMVSHCDIKAKQVRLDELKKIIKASERVEFWR